MTNYNYNNDKLNNKLSKQGTAILFVDIFVKYPRPFILQSEDCHHRADFIVRHLQALQPPGLDVSLDSDGDLDPVDDVGHQEDQSQGPQADCQHGVQFPFGLLVCCQSSPIVTEVNLCCQVFPSLVRNSPSLDRVRVVHVT